MHEGHLSGNFFLKMKVGSFFVPPSEGSGDGVHCLDAMHDPSWDSSRKVRDQGGSILGLIILGSDDIEFESIDIILELFSRVNMGHGEPVHGFLGDVGISEGIFEILFERGESPEGLVGKPLFVANFGLLCRLHNLISSSTHSSVV